MSERPAGSALIRHVRLRAEFCRTKPETAILRFYDNRHAKRYRDPMRKLLVHIGRHKTGTTAIQHFLQDNRARLQDFGYIVPQSGRVKDAHHGLARPLQPRHSDQLDGVQDVRLIKPFANLKRELASQGPNKTAIVSSEGFQNCRPGLVSEAFRDYDAHIVVYLRNQLEYLASSYAQRVHATLYTGTLQDFYKDHYLKGNHYASFLRRWTDSFRGKLSVRRYDGQNVVKDFIDHSLKIPVQALRIRPGRSNPSLNTVVTHFKHELNCRQIEHAPSQPTIYPLLPQLNALFPGPKFALPRATIEDLLANCRDSDNEVAATYFGEAQLFDYTDFSAYSQIDVNNALFEDMYAALLELVSSAEAEVL